MISMAIAMAAHLEASSIHLRRRKHTLHPTVARPKTDEQSREGSDLLRRLEVLPVTE